MLRRLLRSFTSRSGTTATRGGTTTTTAGGGGGLLSMARRFMRRT